MNIPIWEKHPGGTNILQMSANCTTAEKQILFFSHHIGCNWSKVSKHVLARDVIDNTSKNKVELFKDKRKNDVIYDELDLIISNIKEKHWKDDYVWFLHNIVTVIFTVFSLYRLGLHPNIFNAIHALFWNFTYNLGVFHCRHHGYDIFKVIKKSSSLNKRNYKYMNIIVIIEKLYYGICYCYEHTFGIQGERWRPHHNLTHHLYTNSYKQDNDMRNTWFLKRTILIPDYLYDKSPKWINKHAIKIQNFYAPFLFSLFAISAILDNAYLLQKKIYVSNVLFVLFGIIWLWVLPWYYYGFFNGFIYILIFYGLFGFAMGYTFEVSHNSHKTSKSKNYEIDLELNKIDLWYKRQIESSVSYKRLFYGVSEYLTCIYFGGLNLQAEHHIAPALNPIHYYRLHPYLVKICEKHNINFAQEETLFDSIIEYIKWMEYVASKTTQQ